MNVYDFDNTIYRGESGIDLFLYFLKRDPKLMAALPWAVSCITKYKATKMTLDDAVENYAGTIEQYAATIDDIEGNVQKFWDLNSRKIKSFYLKQRRDDYIGVC